MIKKYLSCLYKQYCDARGMGNYFDEGVDGEDFINWVVENRSLLNNYISYLEYLGFNYSNGEALEVGKGECDSLYYKGLNISSIFAPTLNLTSSNFFINDGIPYVIDYDGIVIPKEHVILTHNPYFDSEVLDWPSMHNSGEKNISIGMFGKLDDRDLKRKTDLLKKISENMVDNYMFEYDTMDGNYFYTLNSKAKQKVHVNYKVM